MSKKKNLMTLKEFKEKNYGKLGTKERDKLEAGYESFKIGALIQISGYYNKLWAILSKPFQVEIN